MNIILCGASGAGKTTIANELFKDSNYIKYTSVTSREKRNDEIDGDDYWFYTSEELLSLVNNKKLFNLVEYAGIYYATKEEYPEKIISDKNIVSIIVPKRAIEYKLSDPSNNCIIYILPPDIDTLLERGDGRNINRLASDLKQLNYAYNFDFVVINNDLETCVTEIKKFISLFKENQVNNLNIDLLEQFKNSLIDSNNEYVRVLKPLMPEEEYLI